MNYQKGNLEVISDFDIRIIREDENEDVDVFVDIDGFTVNIMVEKRIIPIVSRLQFPSIKGVLIRFNAREDSRATIVMLRNIDIHSQAANFEIDYRNHRIRIQHNELQVNLILEEKKH